MGEHSSAKQVTSLLVSIEFVDLWTLCCILRYLNTNSRSKCANTQVAASWCRLLIPTLRPGLLALQT